MIVSKSLTKSVVDFVPHTDRTAMIRIKARPVNLNIIQVYAPTTDAADQDLEQFYSDVKDLLKLTKKHEVNIIMRDLNAKLGKGRYENIIGPFGLGTRNERGDRLLQFCQEKSMAVANTWFQHHPRRLYTWKSPRDQTESVVRNQIDYILINSRFMSSIKAACTYPGADIYSDHILLMDVLRISLSKPKKETSRRLMALDKLHDPTVKNNLTNQLNSQIQRLSHKIEGDDVTQSSKEIANVLKTTSQTVLGYRSNNKKQKWITNEILLLMDERRKAKNNKDKYRDLQRQIRSKIRIAKNEWLKKECREIEQLQHKHDDFNLHKKLKETAGVFNENNQIVLNDNEKRQIWEEYVEKLFSDNRPDNELTVENNLTGPSITKEEIEKAIQLAKTNKAAGPDEIPSEILNSWLVW
ncbi:craniofacial development protein 2-like [Sitophilus oryzae]|uniref:Craniofacial development protein 2-like n=1 Tax=Sitophilus oryzae TaxID=7048 RepID=A0A6J2X960_SITOR|nr:craniofacial development protein 2-like [Sitophilus oryzae]